MTRTSQEIGEDWENELATLVSGETVVGSGSTWHSKLDVKDKTILWSAKATDTDSFRVTADVIREAQAAARGPGASGIAWALALKIESVGRFVLMDIDDFLSVMEDDTARYAPSKQEQKRRHARTPQLLREDVTENA